MSEQIVITKTEEIVVDNPRLVLQNLENELRNINKERERLDALEKEIKSNINIIWKAVGAVVVSGKDKWISWFDKTKEIDVAKGDKIFLTQEEADAHIVMKEEVAL